MNSPQLVQSAGPTSAVLWQRLASLFTALNINAGNDAYEESEAVTAALERFAGKEESFAFSEDLLMRGMLRDKTRDEDLNSKEQFEGTEIEQVQISPLLFEDMCSLLSFSRVS